MYKFYLVLWVCLSLSVARGKSHDNDTFPPGFQFGVATAAYQIEGAWNLDGKGPNIWDTYTHVFRKLIVDHSTGDIACDSYYKFRDDLELASYLGVNFYRFSISWSRILPYGYANYINERGVKYYDTLINELVARNITPMVTIYHWDLPQPLQNIGGWPNPNMVDYFADYARILFERFGDRVKWWLTINEPKNVCAIGYGTIYLAPGYVNQSGIADYMCGHTILLAHTKVYHMYKREFYPQQKGKLSMSLDVTWYEPAENTKADKEAAFVKMMFSMGWFANPIFSRHGNYPEVMIDRVATRSKMEHFPRSRLPAFTHEQIESMRGAFDFMGINIYTSAVVKPEKPNPSENEISYFNDIGVIAWQPASWENTSDPLIKVTPWAARKVLEFTKRHYGDVPIIITENGYADKGELRDYKRVEFYKQYLNEIYLALTDDKVNVRGYSAWSLIDNYEWIFGYTQKFGINFVNFSDPNRERRIKNSARCYKKFIATHSIDWDCTGDEGGHY